MFQTDFLKTLLTGMLTYAPSLEVSRARLSWALSDQV